MNLAHPWVLAVSRLAALVLVFFLLTGVQPLAAQPDPALAAELKHQLKAKSLLPLYFPSSVKRFYAAHDYKPVWLVREKGETGHAWQAMMLLDCVLQYGLSYADYHPDELTYDILHDIVEQPAKISRRQQARFEVMLTDAILSFMVHLHYGKLNPELPAAKIDAARGDLRVETVLAQAMNQPDITETLLAVQPKGPVYQEMQYWMRKWKGQYVGDCYEIPEADVRKVALNMERLRWAAIGDQPYVQVDIPSYTLSLFLSDTVYRFRIVAGSRTTPTPLFNSQLLGISLLAAAKNPDQKSAIVSLPVRSMIRFDLLGHHKIVFGEISETPRFRRNMRALSSGDIGVQQPEKFAALLLRADRQAAKIKTLRGSRQAGRSMNIKLRTPLPLKVTYLTCWFQDGQLMTYPDVYRLDQKLEQAIYHQLPKKMAVR